ncbi:MAG: hypothetical protein R2809_05140 [Flavobacteriales bacterium]
MQFAILDGTMEGIELSYSADFRYTISESNREISCIFKYQFLSDKGLHLIIEVQIDFEFEEKSFKSSIVVGENLIIPVALAKHLAMICVGTTRGILHEKTENTTVNNFPIPTINVAKRIKSNLKVSRK